MHCTYIYCAVLYVIMCMCFRPLTHYTRECVKTQFSRVTTIMLRLCNKFKVHSKTTGKQSILLTLGAHAHSEGYSSCRVCMCVCMCV